jgi:phytoene dehydrogenase-like protein
LQYGGGLTTLEVTEPGFYHNLHSINHFQSSASPWFRDLRLGDRVSYMTPHYEFAMPLSDGKALVVGRDLEGRPLPISRPSRQKTHEPSW